MLQLNSWDELLNHLNELVLQNVPATASFTPEGAEQDELVLFEITDDETDELMYRETNANFRAVLHCVTVLDVFKDHLGG